MFKADKEQQELLKVLRGERNQTSTMQLIIESYIDGLTQKYRINDNSPQPLDARSIKAIEWVAAASPAYTVLSRYLDSPNIFQLTMRRSCPSPVIGECMNRLVALLTLEARAYRVTIRSAPANLAATGGYK